MKNNIKKIIANKLVLSFFFTAIIILLIYIFIYKEYVYYVNIINTTSVSFSKNNSNTRYDPISKRLIGYPTYGEKYANLIINSIDLDLPIYHGDNLEILSIGVGHYAGSYFPGEGGTIILAAHNTTGFFKRFEELKIKDIVIVNANYGNFKYEIHDIKIVDENDTKAFKITNEFEELVLYTCYPINGNIIGRKTKRYVVYAKLIGDTYES